MAAVLKDAAKPNLVQTLENNPVLIHGGPFANIAHGCNSVIATRAALALGDYVVTEAGFGADLGAEKFLDIKCRQAGLKPDLAVVVATVRALKLHGGADEKTLEKEDVGAVERGLPNLLRHVENLGKFGLPVLVAINRFLTDSPAELKTIEDKCAAAGAKAYLCEHWAKGGAGAEALARAAVETIDKGEAHFKPLYPDEFSLTAKIETIAKEIYRASGVSIAGPAAKRLKALEDAGYGKLPVCIAKTQYSFAADPSLRGAPTAVGRRGLRRGDGGRDHEHAGPAARAGGGEDRPDGRRGGRRHFLRPGFNYLPRHRQDAREGASRAHGKHQSFRRTLHQYLERGRRRAS
jgi:formate--tetrahydrofolate ligase